MAFVLDASITATWCFHDETNELADIALDRLGEDDAFVPAIWWFEIRNILVVNERRGRISPVETAEFLADLGLLPIQIDREPQSTAVIELARVHTLTAYDAAYLELARRMRIPLATLDGSLVTAAEVDGVPFVR